MTGTTSGCEPLFQKSYKRKKKSVTDANKWEEYDVVHPKLKEFVEMKFKGEQYVLIVGLVDNNPYETWIWKVTESNPIFPLKALNFVIYKEKRGKYLLRWDKMYDADLGQLNISEREIYNVELFAFTRICSAFLRHNPNQIEVLISTIEKINDLNNIPKIITRLLKKYVKDNTHIYGVECPNCKGKLVRESGCHRCMGCGYSSCS